MIFQFIIYAIIANGLYDIASAASIFKMINYSALNRLSIFTGSQSPVFERVLGYYILINGLVRVFGGMNLYQLAVAKIVAGSYFAEAAFIANELFTHKSVDKTKGEYIIGFCLVMGSLASYNYFF
jgi:Erg28 like protein